jgi:hypothetical protein
MNKKQVLAAGGAAAVSLLMAVPAFAATPSVTSNGNSSSSSVAHTWKYAGWHAGTNKKTPNAAFGKITAINGSTITLTHGSKTGKVSVTVTTTDATTYKNNGVADTSTDLAVGQRVIVMGTKDSTGNITDATSVNIMIRQHVKKTKTATTSV